MSQHPKVDNPDIVPFVIYQLGGIGEFVDVEDILVRCHELAPERFEWRKYPYPNYKILSKALPNFKGSFPTYLIKTQDGFCRQASTPA